MDATLNDWRAYAHFTLALVAILDPFMAIPVFLDLAAGRQAAERARLASIASLIVFGVLAGAALGGDLVLRTLGTSIASFRVAGGLVLLLMALAMLRVRVDPAAIAADKRGSGIRGDVSEVVPLAIPLLAGPGAISMVMIAGQGGHPAGVVGAVAVVCLIVWGMLRLAVPIESLLGAIGLHIANRLVGLLLAAIAVESMAQGLSGLFPALAG